MDGLIALAKSVKAQQAVEDAGKYLKIGADGKVVPAAGGGGGGTDIIAAEYSASATYAVGDYCTHSGGLYCCNTAISTAEEWTPAHWTATVVGTALSELKSSKVNLAQGVAKAGQFLVVGADGNVTTQTLQVWQGGSY